MDWIKRNLFFLIGSVIAVALMGLAGWFLYSKWALNNEILTSLNADYETLRGLNTKSPHPGNKKEKIDNVEVAKKQRAELASFLEKTRANFQPIPRIPDVAKISEHDFFTALSQTLAQLQKDATKASVGIQTNYNFSFQAQNNKFSFAPNSLEPLAVQLGEIKTIVDILMEAKVNAIDNIRRSRVGADDNNGPLADYLGEKPVTNELAVLTPYEFTFRAFSSELATVLSALASSPHGFIVKTINVEPAPASAQQDSTAAPTYVYLPGAQSAEPAPMSTAQIYAQRYGMRGGGMRGGEGGGGPGGGIAYQPLGSGTTPYAPPAYPAAAPGAAAASKGGLSTVLDEKLLKITINLTLVKPLPPKKS